MRQGWLGRAYRPFSLRIAPSKFYTFGADGKGLAQEQGVPNCGLQDPCDVGVEEAWQTCARGKLLCALGILRA